jgi:hypothetical protein
MNNARHGSLVPLHVRMNPFPDIYTGRVQHAGWNVIQAATLMEEAKSRRSGSLLIYAALELRLAIEHLVFTIILVAKGNASAATLRACHRPGGLFRELEKIAPLYARKCQFTRVLVSFHPEIPQGEAWDVRRLLRDHAALSEMCHARRSLRGMGAQPEPWDERLALLQEVHAFLAAGLKRDTAVLSFKGATPAALALWRKYARGKVSLTQVRRRFAQAKAPLVSRQPSPRPYPARGPAVPYQISR